LLFKVHSLRRVLDTVQKSPGRSSRGELKASKPFSLRRFLSGSSSRRSFMLRICFFGGEGFGESGSGGPTTWATGPVTWITWATGPAARIAWATGSVARTAWTTGPAAWTTWASADTLPVRICTNSLMTSSDVSMTWKGFMRIEYYRQ